MNKRPKIPDLSFLSGRKPVEVNGKIGVDHLNFLLAHSSQELFKSEELPDTIDLGAIILESENENGEPLSVLEILKQLNARQRETGNEHARCIYFRPGKGYFWTDTSEGDEESVMIPLGEMNLTGIIENPGGLVLIDSRKDRLVADLHTHCNSRTFSPQDLALHIERVHECQGYSTSVLTMVLKYLI